MRSLFWRVCRAVCVIALVPMSIAAAGDADNLGSLDCVSIVVESLAPDARQSGLTEASLSNALLVALKSKAPRLRVDSSCAPFVHVNVTFLLLSKGEEGRVAGFALNLDVEVYREAYIRKIDQSDLLVVWRRGGLVVGPKHSAKTQVLETLNDKVTDFAADYYKAGNS